MDKGAPPEVRLGLPQDLVGDRGGVSFSEQYETDYVHKRVALYRPLLVSMVGNTDRFWSVLPTVFG
jgi:hypothetical protein